MQTEVTEETNIKTSDLRKQVRAEFEPQGISTAWVALATKNEMLWALENEAVPERFTSNGPTTQHPLVNASDEMKALKAQLHPILDGMSKVIATNREEMETDFRNKAKAIKSKVEEGAAASQAALAAVAALEKRIKDDGLGQSSVTVTIVTPDAPVYDAGRQHKLFAELVRDLSLGFSVYLCGPAGSGKTQAAHEAAKALRLPFYCQSVCQATSKSDLIGYFNPTGLIGSGDDVKPVMVRTPLREAYEHGGVYLLDEIDAGNPNVTLILNSALSNGGCSFPDGYITKHKDFHCIAAANTFGAGADRQYVGRNQIDAATLTRFSFIIWDYDEAFETHLSGDVAWAKRVQAIRKAVYKLKERIVVCPRASIDGAMLIKAGGSYAEAEKKFIWKGEPEEKVKKILAAVDGSK